MQPGGFTPYPGHRFEGGDGTRVRLSRDNPLRPNPAQEHRLPPSADVPAPSAPNGDAGSISEWLA